MGKQGRGWLIRLVGGLLTPASWFPVTLSVTISERSADCQITVCVDENFGFGSLIGIEKKIRK